MRRVIAAALCLSSAACFPSTNVCNETTTAVTKPDAGTAYRCTLAADCPRPSNVFVCTTNGLPAKPCVSCDDTNCTLHTPLPCKQ